MGKLFLGESLSVFRSLEDISFVKFPCKLEWLLLAVCIRGSVSARVDLVNRRMDANSIMVLRPGHTVDLCRASDDFEGYFIVLQEEKIHHLLPSMKYLAPYSIHFKDNPIVKLSDTDIESQRAICDLLTVKLSEPQRPYHDMSVSSLVQLLFYETLSIYAINSGDLSSHHTRREELLGSFIDLVEHHYRDQRSVGFYAEKLCVTPKHLSSVLKEVSGKTAGEWIDYRVILEAKLMLRSSSMTIQEISLALNFSNQSFFGKYFKHLTGKSPREFRANIS
ncbi:MAG: helix-turn-helix domain-containing protein [Lachnoclostridium sp.]|nr:helix-turn-helix domain-containing protein [Lachnoclostridium sp.]